MSAYVISNVEVTDPDRYAEYAKLATPAIQKYGGKVHARGGASEVLEGDWQAGRVVVVEFEDMEKAKAFYNSVEYQAAREKRIGAADFKMMVVEGM